MTEEKTEDILAQMRDEFASQLNALKSDLEGKLAQRDENIKALETEKEALKLALLRSATLPSEPEPTPEPTEEEKYAAEVKRLAELTIKTMQERNKA